MKDPQLFSNQADIQAILPTYELVILSKFHKDWQKIVDFLVVATFLASLNFLHQSLFCSYTNGFSRLGHTGCAIKIRPELF